MADAKTVFKEHLASARPPRQRSFPPTTTSCRWVWAGDLLSLLRCCPKTQLELVLVALALPENCHQWRGWLRGQPDLGGALKPLVVLAKFGALTRIPLINKKIRDSIRKRVYIKKAKQIVIQVETAKFNLSITLYYTTLLIKRGLDPKHPK